MSRSLLVLGLVPVALVGCSGGGDGDEDEDCEVGTEVCNGVDDDCDGEIDEDVELLSWYVDSDGDGWGDPAALVEACSQPAGTVANDGDCDDGDDSVHPDGTELCNDRDDDCDGLVDANDGDVVDAEVWWIDGDGDGWGVGQASLRYCEPPEDAVEKGGDCDDQDPTVSPGQDEVCNGVDDDCDALVDDDDPDVEADTWYPDDDGDGYGADDAVLACEEPAGSWADVGGDCDDDQDTVNPAQAEVCHDGLDNDCDGTDNGCLPWEGTHQVLTDYDSLLYGGCSAFGVHTRVGDLDGDGSDEVVASCVGLSSEASSGGGALVFDPPDRGEYLTFDAAVATWTSSTSSTSLGASLDLGDVDGDGYVDIAGLASGPDELWVQPGPLPSGTTTGAEVVLGVPGYSTTTANQVVLADLDGSGRSELAYVDLYGTIDTTYQGALIVLDSWSDGDEAFDVYTGALYGGTSASYFGFAVQAGDADGDGLEDLAVSSIYSSEDGVWIVTGDEILGTRLLTDDVDRGVIVDSTSGRGDFGYALGELADLDGDGHADLAVGAPSDASYDSSSLYVYLGPLDDLRAAGDADGVYYTGDSTLGRSVATVPDMDGDGDDELLFGSYSNSTYGSYAGAAFLVYDPVGGAVSVSRADAIFYGDYSSTYAGYAVAGLPDLDGDGFGEAGVVAYGYNYLTIFAGGGL